MSWSKSVTQVQDGVDAKLKLEAEPMSGQADLEEAITAANKATDLAIELIESGVIGDGPYYININGHANPNPMPEGNYAGDVVTVMVGRHK